MALFEIGLFLIILSVPLSFLIIVVSLTTNSDNNIKVIMICLSIAVLGMILVLIGIKYNIYW